jgi:hypothetical protein
MGRMPGCMVQMRLCAPGLHQEGSTDGDESHADAAEGELPAQECSQEKHAAGRDEEITADFFVPGIRHITLLIEGPTQIPLLSTGIGR